MIDYGKDIYSAIAAPRVHHQLLPNMAVTEHGYDRKMELELETRNHTVLQLPQAFSISAVQAVRRLPDGSVEAASDPRKMGLAAAY
jgi:gamma-glutamyltranspeptidase/glutathione hydrolase/leukotriene-C4 hydrolase